MAPQPHFILVPFMAQGHMIPMIDVAKLLSHRGVIITIVSTHQNFLRCKSVLDRAIQSGLPIRLLNLKFPSQEVGLPQGCETVDAVPSLEMLLNFFAGAEMLQHPLEKSLAEMLPRPSCIISDVFFAWTAPVATKFQIPRLLFHGTSCFSLLCIYNIYQSKFHESIDSDSEPFLIPNLPDEIEINKSKLPGGFQISQDEVSARSLQERMRESEKLAYGVVINSFDELEPKYAELYKEAKNNKTWCIGPVSLCNKEELDVVQRGNEASIDENQCLKWLDSKEPSSVIYACLGSVSRVPSEQLIEIGLALEASDHPFIWVVKNQELENWISEEKFEERIQGRGLVIKGWAPQVMILSHPAVGGFLTHCGWNSTLEGLCAGVGMLTWPMFAEQFLNEKLIVQVLKVGYRVGADVSSGWGENVGVVMKKEEIEVGVRRLMDKSDEEGEEIRRRAREIGKMARKAVEEGGSSYLNITLFIQDIMSQAIQNGVED